MAIFWGVFHPPVVEQRAGQNRQCVQLLWVADKLGEQSLPVASVKTNTK